ncbi:MAG: putative transporter substrate-binding protein [Acidimicrobiaceae bacterium]|nr:putative transporter substrate-binding protein [Acidimicrobiaceae bacterium]
MMRKRGFTRIALIFGVLCLVGALGTTASLAKTPPKTPPLKINPIFTYNKADREAHLYACAKQEGSVTFYTSSSATDPSLKPAFQAQYPGVAMNDYVATSPLVTRLETEEDSGHHVFDVYNDAMGNIVRDSKYFQPFFSPYSKLLQPALTSPYYMASNGYILVGVYYNPNLIPTSQVPKTWKQLLEPQFAGKIYMGTDSTAPAFAALLRRTYGTAYYAKLAKQVRVVNVSGRGVADLIEAGTAPMGIDMSSSYYERDHVGNNAPLLLQVLQPTLGQFQASSISKYAPHPCAAMLLVDWLNNPKEGGKVLQSLGNAMPYKSSPPLPFSIPGQLAPAKWTTIYQTSNRMWTGFKIYSQAYGAWTDLYNRFFINGGH